MSPELIATVVTTSGTTRGSQIDPGVTREAAVASGPMKCRARLLEQAPRQQRYNDRARSRYDYVIDNFIP